MKAIYYAFDGKDFDDEDECQEYELKLMRQNLEVKMFNREGNNEENLEQAFFIYVPNSESWEKLADYAKQLGLAYPPKEGLWEWNESGKFCCEWTPVEEHINKLRSETERLETIISKCMIGE